MVELRTENLLSAELGKSSPLPDIKNVVIQKAQEVFIWDFCT